MGGDRVLIAALAAGVVAGGAGAYVLTGAGTGGAGGTPGTGIVACPDDQLALLRIGNGQKMLVTGRTADGGWYRVYLGSPGRPAGWVKASEVTLQAAADSLPVVDCNPDAGTADAPAEPQASLTAIVDAPAAGSPSPQVTATPTAGPSAVPETAPPTVGPTGTPKATRTPKPPPTATPRVRVTAKPTVKPTKKPPPPPTATPAPTPTPDTTKPTIGDLEADTEIVHTCHDGQSPALAPDHIRFFAYRVRDTGGTGIKYVHLYLILHDGGIDYGPYPMDPRTYPGQYAVTVQGNGLDVGRYSWYIIAADKAGNEAVSDFAPVGFDVDIQCTTYDGP